MLLRRVPLLLLLLLLAAGRCSAASLLHTSTPLLHNPDRDRDLDLDRERRAGPEPLPAERHSRSLHGADAHHRDPRHKKKFIEHLTGPLSFSPKCRKHFNRLYHNTRDCTLPAYYKRCARLLVRLANNPRCMDR